MSAADYIAMYDAHVAALTTLMEDPATAVAPGGPWRGKVGGPSLGGLSVESAEGFLRPLLTPANHTPPSTRVEAITFHKSVLLRQTLLWMLSFRSTELVWRSRYAMCDNATAIGLEAIFPSTLNQLSSLTTLQR